MNLHPISKGIYSSIFLFALTGSVFANNPQTMQPIPVASPGKLYMGVFGGGGAAYHMDANQFGTAFYFEAAGGPLAVNAFGHTNHPSVWFAGGQIGYQAPAILLDCNSQWMLVPAVELEGYYIGKTTYTGDLTNDTTRLPEHDFEVRYPMQSGVFLTNAVLNFNIPCFLLHPYVGVGIGGAIVRISGADATQIDPPEAGVNHYNSKTSDLAPAFAGQIKIGFSYDISNCVNLFAEYRWLYLSTTHFNFGSTVYPNLLPSPHPATSSWQVTLDSQYYNMGSVGIRYSF